MLTKPLEHVIYTNVGRNGYDVVLQPREWRYDQFEEVKRWLASLKLAKNANEGYASGFFNFDDSRWSAIALLDAGFGQDQHKRQGVLHHALLTPVDESDGAAAHQVALVQALQDLRGSAPSRDVLGASSKMESYKIHCGRHQRLIITNTNLERLGLSVEDTLPFLLASRQDGGAHPVKLPSTGKSIAQVPMRLALAVAALPPRLRNGIQWGFKVQPNPSLQIVVHELAVDAQPPTLPGPSQEYHLWLTRQIKSGQAGHLAISQALSNWSLKRWDDLGQIGRLSSIQPAAPAFSPPVASTPQSSESTKRRSLFQAEVVSPAEVTMAKKNLRKNQAPKPSLNEPETPTETVSVREGPVEEVPVENGPVASDFPLTAEFAQKQLEAMRRDLDRSIKVRFEMLEKSLGAELGSSTPTDSPAAKVGAWLRKAERPLLYLLLFFVLGMHAWPLVKPVIWPSGSETELAENEHQITNEQADSGQSTVSADVPKEGGDDGKPEESQKSGNDGENRRMTSYPDFKDSWLETWQGFAQSETQTFADWCSKVSQREGLETENVSPTQSAKFAALAEALKKNQSLNGNDRAHARKGLFEYAIARWVTAKGYEDRIVVNLVRTDIAQDLLTEILTDLKPVPLPENRDVEDADLQAAVFLTWMQQEKENEGEE